MAYVNAPMDLSKVKNKLIFNLTKRQLICFGIAGVVGIPVYFLTRPVLGTTGAATLMVFLMLPAFLFALYEKNGLPLEQILANMIRMKWIRPQIREYEIKAPAAEEPENNVTKRKKTTAVKNGNPSVLVERKTPGRGRGGKNGGREKEKKWAGHQKRHDQKGNGTG